MPFKSKAQRRYFHAAADKGKISEDTVKEWEKKTKGKLPEKVEKESSLQAMSKCEELLKIFSKF